MAKNTANLSGEASSPLLFRHVSPGPGDSTLQFRLLHFWEARKNVKGGPDILLGIEMLMIDSEVYLHVSLACRLSFWNTRTVNCLSVFRKKIEHCVEMKLYRHIFIKAKLIG